MNLPNKLTLLRIILIPVVISLFFLHKIIPYSYIYATIVYCIAAFTDFLDGYIARKYNLVTDLGKFLDPIADKILVLCTVILLVTNEAIFGYAGYFGTIIGGVGACIIVAREMMVSVLRMVAATKGKVLAAEMVGKIKTFVTDISLPIMLIYLDFLAINELLGKITFYVGFVLYIISVILTIISGTIYLVKNKDVLK